MPLPNMSGGPGLPPGLDYADMQTPLHVFSVPAGPVPPTRRSRRPSPPCVVPDIDLLCEESLSEEEEEEEEGEDTAVLWTRLKDPARHSFWEGIEYLREAERGGLSGQDDCSDTSPPPDKKRRILSPAAWPEVRPADCPEAVVGGRGRQGRLCSDSQEVKAAVAVQVTPAATARGEVGQDGPPNIRSYSELSKDGAGESSSQSHRQASPAATRDVTLSSWQPLPYPGPYRDHGDDDFHTVPDVDVSPGVCRQEEGGELQLDADSGTTSVGVWGDVSEDGCITLSTDNLTTTPHLLPPHQATHDTSESFINEDEATQEEYYDEEVDSPLGSQDSYVLYSSQSSDEDESDPPRQRPLASCDVSYHQVPNAVIEE